LYALFGREAIRRVPIVDHDEVVGMVSLDDALVSTAARLGDLAGVLSAQIMFPHARAEAHVPAVITE
jgi:CBS domain-containing protein